jgi:hypothetical protein
MKCPHEQCFHAPSISSFIFPETSSPSTLSRTSSHLPSKRDNHFSVFVRVSFELQNSISKLAIFVDTVGKNSKETLTKTLKWLSLLEGRWLLVLDNVDGEEVSLCIQCLSAMLSLQPTSLFEYHLLIYPVGVLGASISFS